jgi:hypothetical protein
MIILKSKFLVLNLVCKTAIYKYPFSNLNIVSTKSNYFEVNALNDLENMMYCISSY